LTSKIDREKYKNIIDKDRQMKIEKDVSNYIQNNLSFVTFKVDNQGRRLELESKIISTVSLCPECKASKNWLGNFSTRDKIRESGMWLIQELCKEPLNNEDIQYLEKINGMLFL
jgi:hypothetical protein